MHGLNINLNRRKEVDHSISILFKITYTDTSFNNSSRSVFYTDFNISSEIYKDKVLNNETKNT